MERKSLLKHSTIIFIILATTQCTPQKTGTSTKVTYLHPYGVELHDEKDFFARGGTGEVIRNLSNGVVTRDKFRDGKLHGKVTETFPHQEIFAKLKEYENGDLVSETENTTAGTPKERRYFANGKLAHYTTWYEDGTPQGDEQFINGLLVEGQYYSPSTEVESEIKNGSGTKTKRDSFGSLLGKEFYNNGILTSEDRYYPTGAIQTKLQFLNGKIEGELKTFFPGGEPKTIEEYVDNKPHGITLVFQNGERVAKVPYQKGTKQGIETQFVPGTDKIVSEIRWENDKRHGPCVTYVDENKITEWFFNDKRVSKHQFNELASQYLR